MENTFLIKTPPKILLNYPYIHYNIWYHAINGINDLLYYNYYLIEFDRRASPTPHVILSVFSGGPIVFATGASVLHWGGISCNTPHDGVNRTSYYVTWDRSTLTYPKIPNNVHKLILEERFHIVMKSIWSIVHTTYLVTSEKIELILYHLYDPFSNSHHMGRSRGSMISTWDFSTCPTCPCLIKMEGKWTPPQEISPPPASNHNMVWL